MSDDELKQLVASNAKSIEALSNAVVADKEERRSFMSQLYQYLGRIAASQSNFYEVQADYYHQLAALQERQTRNEEKQPQMQAQITAAQSNFYEIQADYYHQLAALQERQTRNEEKQAQMQTQIVSILKHLSILQDEDSQT